MQERVLGPWRMEGKKQFFPSRVLQNIAYGYELGFRHGCVGPGAGNATSLSPSFLLMEVFPRVQGPDRRDWPAGAGTRGGPEGLQAEPVPITMGLRRRGKGGLGEEGAPAPDHASPSAKQATARCLVLSPWMR